MTIIKSHIDHLEYLVPLFNDYRIFYKQSSDKKGVGRYLLDRFKNK